MPTKSTKERIEHLEEWFSNRRLRDVLGQRFSVWSDQPTRISKTQKGSPKGTVVTVLEVGQCVFLVRRDDGVKFYLPPGYLEPLKP